MFMEGNSLNSELIENGIASPLIVNDTLAVIVEEEKQKKSAKNTTQEGDPIQSKSKKRKLDLGKWKKKPVEGKKSEAYINSRGNQVNARIISGTCGEKCIYNCTVKVKKEKREYLFHNYWKLGKLQEQRHYLLSCLKEINSKKQHSDGRRKPNNAYYFKIDGEDNRVCKQFFLATLGISNRSVRTDKRGKHNKHKTVDKAIRTGIVEHINSIPRMESHYLRAQTSREFIEGGKTVADLHRDYVESCRTENKPYGNYCMYFRIFNKDFNISFFSPKKDQCSLCEQFKNSSEDEKKKIENQYTRHIIEKTLSRQKKEKNKKEASEGKLILAYFDLEAVLPTPCDHCFIWHEGEGSRGVNEIGTCVLKYLETLGQEKPVIFYCDNCSGQNKNKFMVSVLMNAVLKLRTPSITLNFLTVRHTQTEGDMMHSLIEKQKKGR
ncbi:hypothetical protein RN001_006012 [Aquatica leii]|uniref:DUF7869 domain-containing protein n=1 Tax=Aquatica leii TaxID=1421715 RepID=A0AAN7QKQ0_9COLE|nr:hypothetical protein RN001_006012 [Aquatica leii]